MPLHSRPPHGASLGGTFDPRLMRGHVTFAHEEQKIGNGIIGENVHGSPQALIDDNFDDRVCQLGSCRWHDAFTDELQSSPPIM